MALAVMATMAMSDLKLRMRGIFLPFPDLAGGFEAIHLRHLHIHENDVVSLAFERPESIPRRCSATSA